MKNFDERQEQVHGRIMTRAFLITIILMLLAAFLNDIICMFPERMSALEKR